MAGVIVNGKYYKNPDEAPEHVAPKISSQVSSYNLNSQAIAHDMELIQPYDHEGKPNPDFARYYPELAKDYGMDNLL